MLLGIEITYCVHLCALYSVSDLKEHLNNEQKHLCVSPVSFNFIIFYYLKLSISISRFLVRGFSCLSCGREVEKHFSGRHHPLTLL